MGAFAARGRMARRAGDEVLRAADGTTHPPLVLRLYVAGDTPNSALALANLRAVLDGRLHRLEIVDVLTCPERALDDGVFVTPTLVRYQPEPPGRIVGSMDAQNGILATLAGL
jgi:circadian clock protein KaiB